MALSNENVRSRSARFPTLAPTKSVAPPAASFSMEAVTASSSPTKATSAGLVAPSLSSMAL